MEFKMNESKKSTRVQLELPDRSMQRLISLKDKTESASYAEVIKNALRLYEDIITQYDNGHEFVVRNTKTNADISYKIFT